MSEADVRTEDDRSSAGKIVNVDFRSFNWSTRDTDKFNLAATPDALGMGCLRMPDGKLVVILPATEENDDGETVFGLTLMEFSDKEEALELMSDVGRQWIAHFQGGEPVVKSVVDYISNPERAIFRTMDGTVLRGEAQTNISLRYLSMVAESHAVSVGQIYATVMGMTAENN